jgi:hypothetical protein
MGFWQSTETLPTRILPSSFRNVPSLVITSALVGSICNACSSFARASAPRFIGEALEHFNRALTYAPKRGDALAAKSLALLALGDYREGWELYESGIGHRGLRDHNPFSAAPAWDGKPAPEKHLLIWTEQGLGDALQFIRYAELCRQPPNDGVFHVDEHVSMMSLPHRFGTLLETVPTNIPYLRVDPELQAKWTARFPKTVDGFKVRLVWGGTSANKMDAQRSISLERMKPWLDLHGARFYSLQKDKPADEVTTLGFWDRLINYMDEVADFADTAAIVQNLDLSLRSIPP